MEHEMSSNEIAQQLKKKQALFNTLSSRAIFYKESLRTLKKAKRGLIQSNVLKFILLFSTVFPLVTALSLAVAPDSRLTALLRDLMLSQFPTWSPTDLSVLVNSAIGLSILLAFTWGLCFLLKTRVTALQRAPKELADALTQLDDAVNEKEERVAERHLLREKVLKLSATLEEIDDHVEQERDWLQKSE